MVSAYKKQARASLKTLAGISIFFPDFFNRLRLGSTVWPAWWYCVHIIVNITDPIKAVVHIRSPPLYHWPRESLCQSCCKLCAV